MFYTIDKIGVEVFPNRNLLSYNILHHHSIPDKGSPILFSSYTTGKSIKTAKCQVEKRKKIPDEIQNKKRILMNQYEEESFSFKQIEDPQKNFYIHFKDDERSIFP